MTRPQVIIRCHQLTNVAPFDRLARALEPYADVRLITDASSTSVTIDGDTTNGNLGAHARLLWLLDRARDSNLDTPPAPVRAALDAMDDSLSRCRQARKLYAVGQTTAAAFERAAVAVETAIADVRRAIAESLTTASPTESTDA